MKEKIKRISSSTWALLLALMMVVSSFSVLAATTNVEKTGAGALGGTISKGDILYYDFSSLTTPGVNYYDGKDVRYTGSFSGTCYNGQWLDNKVLAVDVQENITFKSDSGQTIVKASQNGWNTDLKATQIPEDGQNCIKVSISADNSSLSYTWTTYSASTKVATSVSLSSNATDGKIAQGTDLTLTATATGKVDGEVTYTFYNSGNQVGQAQTITASTATTTVSDLSAGDYTFTVKVTKDGYTEVASDPINVTVTGGEGYFLYNGSSEPEDLTKATSLGKFSGNTLSLDLDSNKNYYLFVVKDNNFSYSYLNSNMAFGSDNSVVLHDYDNNNNNHKIKFTPSTSGKYKFTWSPGNGQGTLKYELESTPVAKSVNLTADATEKSVGDSVNLTANVTDLNSGAASNVKYTFTEVNENGNAVGFAKEGTTKTATFTNLTQGTHYYKVEVSAEGYKSVTATTSITVKKHNIATSVVASTTSLEVTYGNDVQVTAELKGKYEGYTGNVTYTLLDENGDAVSGVAPITTNQTNVVFKVTKPSTGEHTYKVSASAENYETVVSNTVTVTVNPINITSKVTLKGPNPGWVYNVGDSIELKASCEDAPEGVNVKYNYYINGTKINGSATPNIVTYKFTASDVGTITFYAEAVADNYNTVKSAEISASVIMKSIASGVTVTADPSNAKTGSDVTITATLTGDVQSGNFTYTFSDDVTKVNLKTVESNSGSATITTSDLAVGTHNISVTVSGDNFQSVTSSTPAQVVVSDAYHDETVNNATSGKTIVVAYDTDKNRDYIHSWEGGSIDGTTTAGKMGTVDGINNLHYRIYQDSDLSATGGQINFLLKVGQEGFNDQTGDIKDSRFVKGTQFYYNNGSADVYTPLTFTKLNVPTEINDDNSTKFVFTVGGGLPNFFKYVVQSTTIKPEYTVTITDPDDNVVGKISSNNTEITLDKLALSKNGKYTFTVTDGIDTVSYTKDLQITHLDVDNYNATVNASDNATITVTCKNTTIAGGSTGELPEKRNAIISVTDIKEGYKVKSVFVKSGTTEIPVTTQQYGTYSFTMPSSDVTITVDVVAKSQYAVNFGVSDKTNGSITAKADSTSINSGERITEDTKVTFTVTNSTGYVVDGWYSDASYENKIDGVADNATTYTTTISKTTDVYVKISENHGTLEPNLKFVYGSNDNPKNWKNFADVYKKTDGSYYVKLDYTKLNKSTNYYYGLSEKTLPLESENDLWWQKDNDKVTYSSTNSDAVANELKDGGYYPFKHFGYFVLKDTSNMFGLTMKITPNTGNNGGEYQIIPSVKTAPKGALEVYAKDGTLNTTSGYGDTTVSGMNADCEGFEVDNGNYKQYAAMPGDRLTITTVVNDEQAAQGWYVSNYVINGVGYDAISTVKALALAQAGSTGASYTIATPYSVTGKETKKIIEITPIYKNRNIEAANDYITLYANADSLGDAWGNTISVYAYYYKESGSTEAYCMNSAYPGDPMMKTSSGLFVSYVPKHYWQANGSEMKMLTNTVSGVTFNNYAEKETVHQKVLEGKQLQNNQTYDYDDFKLIADAGYDTVLYDFKYYNNPTTNQSTLVNNGNNYDTLNPLDKIDPSDYADTTSHNGWEVLTNMDNEEVSLLGYSARNASTIGKTFDNKDRLHIVSVGNIKTSMGVWSTVWFVYDKDNKLVTYGIPSDFIPRYTEDKNDKQVESETQTAAYKAIKDKQLEYTGAYITYESEMDASSSTDTKNSGYRSDGRWYYSRAVDQVKVNTHVLYADDTDSASWTEDNYGNDYAGTFTGAKALVGTERTTSVDRNSEVSISATALSKGTANKQYKFIGWTANATKGEDGTYTIVKNPSMTDSAQTVKVSTNMDLYALYIPVANGDLIITHEKFTGENAFGGPGRYFVQAKLYDSDNVTVKHTYYQEGSVTIPDYTEKSGKIVVQLIVYSVNGSRYKATYNYQNETITDETHVDKVCSSGDPAVVERTINASDIFDGNTMKTSKVDFYSDLQTNNITVKMNYYNRKVENGKPADMDSTPTSYSYIFTSYPKEVLNNDGTLISIPTLIEYAKNHSQQPDNMIEKYVSWNSQKAVKDTKTGITSYMNYHTNANYEATPFHTDQYGNVQSKGEKWVTYYDRNGVEVAEDNATAETVSSISIWYFNTPKKYTYTLNTANLPKDLVGTGDGSTYYGKDAKTANGLFYNTRLFGSDREVSDAASPYTKAYGVYYGFTGQKINTAKTIEKDGTTLKFLYWAYDTAGKKIASTNIQYGLRITNNTTLYAIYGKNEITAPGLTVQEVTPDTFFDSNNISKTRINTIFNPYNCKDNDENIDSASVVYLRVSNATTEKSLNNLADADLQDLRTQISTVVSKASYEKFKSGEVDSGASAKIVQISGSTASGFKFKIVNVPSSSSTELQTSLSNKNRGQFTTTFTTSILKNYTYYVFATMGYKNYNGADKSVVKGSDGISYITSENFAKYDFDKDGKYVASANS